jgi:hypothetical protein
MGPEAVYRSAGFLGVHQWPIAQGTGMTSFVMSLNIQQIHLHQPGIVGR